MRFQLYTLSALATVTTLLAASSVTAGHARGYRQRVRSINAGIESLQMLRERATAGSVQISMNQLQSLQSYTTAYHGWITGWLDQQPAGSPSVAQLRQDYEQFDGWVNGWLSQAMGITPGSASSPSPSSAPSAPPATSTPSVSPQTSSPPAQISPPSSANSSPPSSAAKPQTSVAPKTASPSTDKATPGAFSGGFDAQAANNVAVYWGGSSYTSQVDLAKTCSNPSVNMVVLAFLTDFETAGGYPTINFGNGCSSQPSTAQQQKGATGLSECDVMSRSILACQKAGKKVILSLGGAISNVDFKSDDDATKVAAALWDLFAGGKPQDWGMRPFGPVILDGFDVDTESKHPQYYSTFVTQLREQMKKDPARHYYITAAPQCPIPDASIPLDAMQQMDFVWVQFYNNGPCNVGASGFATSFQQWSQNLAAKGAGPKLYIGAPGCPDCAGSGYVQPGGLAQIMKSVPAVKNMGGVMLWDGPGAIVNAAGGKDYLQVVKEAMG